jgi:RNA 2',3'-cyclic 3'-phosphodiesterase
VNDSLRAFISLPVAPEVVRNIVACQQELAAKTGDRVRWTPEEQMHLTLQFLGNISLAEVERIQGALAGVARTLHLRAEGIGGFPSSRNPRVIWVGLGGDIDELKAFQASVEEATGHREERKFHPHLTIGRVREGRKLNVKLEPWKDKHFGSWDVRELLLMQSKLSPKGATHSVIARFTPAP